MRRGVSFLRHEPREPRHTAMCSLSPEGGGSQIPRCREESRALPAEDGLDGGAVVHLLHADVEVGGGEELDQLVDGEAAVAVPLDHAGHEVGRVRLALDGAEELLAGEHELEDVDVQLEFEGRGADLHVLAAVARERDAGLDEGGDTGGVDGDGGAAGREGADGVGERRAFGQRGAVDGVGGAEVVGERQARGDAVDADDLLAALDFGTHDGRKPDAAKAHDADDVVGAGLGDVDDGARAGLDPAAKGREELEFASRVDQPFHVDDRGLFDDGEIGK
nr:hypothetical protein CFP56_02654 [Quercus suber]